MTVQTNAPSDHVRSWSQPMVPIVASKEIRTRSWAGIAVEVADLGGPGPVLENRRSNQPRLTAILRQVGGNVEMRLTPYPPIELEPHESAARHLTLTPADAPLWQVAEQFHSIRRLTIDFDLPALSARFGDAIEVSDGFAPRFMFTHNGLLALTELLADACLGEEAECDPYGDSLALAIAYNLFRTDRRLAKRSGLAPAQLRRVTAHMEKSLFDPTSLKGLADMAGLSPSYFSRAFKTSTGIAPHKWYLTERVRRAQMALLETDHALSDVALATGFADQSHFTRAFRTITGITPGAWRRNKDA